MKETFRCSICNKVSSQELEDGCSPYHEDYYVPDPKDKLHWICLECAEIIFDINKEFEDEE